MLGKNVVTIACLPFLPFTSTHRPQHTAWPPIALTSQQHILHLITKIIHTQIAVAQIPDSYNTLFC